MNNEVSTWASHWNKMAQKTNALDQVNRSLENIEVDSAYVCKVLELKQQQSFVDFCCGNGVVTARIAEKCKMGIGIDASKDQIAQAIKLAKHQIESKNLSFEVGDITQTKFDDQEFDHALCLTACHYFPSEEYTNKVMTELLRITKPHAKILLTHIPSQDSVGYLLWRLIRNPSTTQPVHIIEMHPTLNWRSKLLHRFMLLFRRISGRKVESDQWRWFKKDFFLKFSHPDIHGITISNSPSETGWIRYRIDVLVQKK